MNTLLLCAFQVSISVTNVPVTESEVRDYVVKELKEKGLTTVEKSNSTVNIKLRIDKDLYLEGSTHFGFYHIAFPFSEPLYFWNSKTTIRNKTFQLIDQALGQVPYCHQI